MTRRITHVAVQYNGKTYSLPEPNRHHHVIRLIGGVGGPSKQGFLDEDGKFLSRAEAYDVATATGQIRRPNDPGKYQGTDLYSEDIW